jgi:hypothetical protein
VAASARNRRIKSETFGGLGTPGRAGGPFNLAIMDGLNQEDPEPRLITSFRRTLRSIRSWLQASFIYLIRTTHLAKLPFPYIVKLWALRESAQAT